MPTRNLLTGNSKSCGCTGRQKSVAAAAIANFKHGHNMLNSPTYVSWQAMKRRCRGRRGYADRGITVDPRWDSFENFLDDMGERPNGTTLDRIDNDGPYSPQNCRWAGGKTQGNNRGNNRWITYGGRTQTISEWAREVGLSRGVLFNRITVCGWDVERALTTPVRGPGPHRS